METELDAEAERGTCTWASPVDIARLLFHRDAQPCELAEWVPDFEAVQIVEKLSSQRTRNAPSEQLTSQDRRAVRENGRTVRAGLQYFGADQAT